jgi:hypothetical protein
MVLEWDEIERFCRRIERYLGLAPGTLSPDRWMEQPIPRVIGSQDATEEYEMIQVAPGEREQVVYDLWKILQTVSALKR